MPCRSGTPIVGRIYKIRRWAEKAARGRPITKVRGGWKIGKYPKRRK